MRRLPFKLTMRQSEMLKECLTTLVLSLSAAINVFLKTVARENRIPFKLKADLFYSLREYGRIGKAGGGCVRGQSRSKAA